MKGGARGELGWVDGCKVSPTHRFEVLELCPHQFIHMDADLCLNLLPLFLLDQLRVVFLREIVLLVASVPNI